MRTSLLIDTRFWRDSQGRVQRELWSNGRPVMNRKPPSAHYVGVDEVVDLTDARRERAGDWI
jgi:hypothetical protein